MNALAIVPGYSSLGLFGHSYNEKGRASIYRCAARKTRRPLGG